MSKPETMIHCGDCVTFMRGLPDEYVDLTVTSPPYDGMRAYNGYSFDYEETARELYRITKNRGVVVWIIGDETKNGTETGTSFKQALFFKSCGFNLHDTMIWNKGAFSSVGTLRVRYASVFEYMFIFSKGLPKTFNPIKDRPNKSAGKVIHGTNRLPDGSVKRMTSQGKIIQDLGQRFNVWEMSAEMSRKKYAHPAPFPLSLARDHILSWSNVDDLIFDPFLGSGTTALAALQERRRFIGCDVSPEYVEMSKKRMVMI